MAEKVLLEVVLARNGDAIQPGGWLPVSGDGEYLLSIMAEPVYEPGMFANYIAPPRRGIHHQPIDFEYVRTEQ